MIAVNTPMAEYRQESANSPCSKKPEINGRMNINALAAQIRKVE